MYIMNHLREDKQHWVSITSQYLASNISLMKAAEVWSRLLPALKAQSIISGPSDQGNVRVEAPQH